MFTSLLSTYIGLQCKPLSLRLIPKIFAPNIHYDLIPQLRAITKGPADLLRVRVQMRVLIAFEKWLTAITSELESDAIMALLASDCINNAHELMQMKNMGLMRQTGGLVVDRGVHESRSVRKSLARCELLGCAV